jgi:hypothetical protein
MKTRGEYAVVALSFLMSIVNSQPVLPSISLNVPNAMPTIPVLNQSLTNATLANATAKAGSSYPFDPLLYSATSIRKADCPGIVPPSKRNYLLAYHSINSIGDLHIITEYTECVYPATPKNGWGCPPG